MGVSMFRLDGQRRESLSALSCHGNELYRPLFVQLSGTWLLTDSLVFLVHIKVGNTTLSKRWAGCDDE
jgi:hypothetical protein